MPAELHPAHFRSLIRRRGERIRWFKAYRCPCSDPSNNYYERECENHCHLGHLYREQILLPTQKALVQGAKWQLQPEQIGLVQIGDARIATMPDEIPLERPDKIILIQRELTAREVLKKGVGDTLAHDEVKSVIAILDSAGVFYLEGVSWTRVDNVITWIPNAVQPNDGDYYSVEYLYSPQFWFLGIQKIAPRPTNVEPGVKLPLRGILTYKHPSAVEPMGGSAVV